MKRTLVLVAMLALAIQPGLATTQALTLTEPEDTVAPASSEMPPTLAQDVPDPGGGGMPPRPIPAKPIPYHEPGRPSRAVNYTTEVTLPNDEGVEETVQLTGVDALVADGADPLAGNHTLVDWDKLLFSAYDNVNLFAVKALGYYTPTLRAITDTAVTLGNYQANDVAAGDLNGDGLAEEIAAWIGPGNHLFMSIGEMPGAQRATSAPAVVAAGTLTTTGHALDFDGLDDYVTAGTGIALANSSFTVAFWARRDAVGKDHFAVGHGLGVVNQGLHLGFLGSNDRFRCSFHGNDLDTPETYTDTDWHHWACTYDAVTNLRIIYRDGLEVARDVSSADYQGSGELEIGRYLADSRAFEGLIDEVGIWNVARSQSQIQADHVRSTPDMTSLLAYWQLDEGSGATAADASGNGHDGTLEGPLWTSLHAPVGDLHMLVRGYDETLWHCIYDVDSDACLSWDNAGGGILASAPTVASRGPGQFDVFALGTDGMVYQQHWDAGGWWADWAQEPPDPMLRLFASAMPTRAVPGPNWDGPAAVARDGGIDLFRVASDNTLRWRRSDGTTWGAWQNLGGMLASGPGAVSLGTDQMQVFARGVDEALWTRSYDGSWGAWDRVPLDGMDTGVTVASAPAAASPAVGEVTVYVRGSDDRLWSVSFTGGSWGTWSAEAGPLTHGTDAVFLNSDTHLFTLSPDGHLMHRDDAGAWAEVAKLNPRVTYDTGAIAAEPSPSIDIDSFDVDVATGHLMGNGREQIVLAYRDAADRALYRLQVMDAVSGFEPAVVSELAAPISTGGALQLTTGDFNGDGCDEIATIRLVTDRNHWQVQVWSADTETLVPLNETLVYSYGRPFQGTLNVTAGDFDADGFDEIATSHDWGSYSDGYLRYHALFYIFDDLLQNLAQKYSHDLYYGPERESGVSYRLTGFALAAGDVDHDGFDEIVRTWPTGFRYGDWPHMGRNLEVLDATDLAAPTQKAYVYLGWSDESYADALTVGDLDRDLVDEIAVFKARSEEPYDYSLKVHVYEYLDGDLVWRAAATPNPIQWWGLASTRLVAADTTGESLRVGPPNYRIQNRVDSLVAVINTPPKHQDYIKVDDGGGNFHYELFEIGLDGTAEHALSSGGESEVGVQSQRDWAIGAGLDAKVTAGGAFVDTSLETSYGSNFITATGTITATSFTQSAEADTSDRIVYFGTPYRIWEYPVLVDGSQEPQDYITVIFPVPAEGTGVTRPAHVIAGDFPQAPWHVARHQTYNAWSYDPIGTPTFPDYDPTLKIIEPTECAGGGCTYAFSTEATQSYATTKEKTHDFSAEVGVGCEGGFSFLGAKFGASVRASVNGSYSRSDVQTENQTTTEGTDITWEIGDLSDGQFKIVSYGYWGEDGYLVLNYQTDMPPAGEWADLYPDPDPAFILPWAGFPYGDNPRNPVTGLELFSPEILVVPESASVGDTVSISATVRNFSNVPASNVLVRFCQGDPGPACAPGGAAHIGETTIPRLNRNLDGPVTISVTWQASGIGKQRIYAVIDPENDIDPEVHDEDDLINNNTAYTTVKIGAVGIVDHGVAAEQPYQSLSYEQGAALGQSYRLQDYEQGEAWKVMAYMPPGNLEEIVYFELQDAALSVPGAVGKPFELVSFEGDTFSEEPSYDLSLTPGSTAPPAVITLAQPDISVATLNLYRATDNLGTAWTEAVCPGHENEILRFTDDNLLYVPICQAGLFVFAETTPGAVLAPVAQFGAAPTSGAAPLTVQFTDQSTNAPTAWLWDFDDGNTSTEQHPVHVYTAAGAYGVTLTATNAVGSDVASGSIDVVAGHKVYLPLVLRAP